MASITGDKEPPPQQDGRGGKIVKMGYLKKLKTMKKKFFILRAAESSENSSKLEYYDNEKKWRNNQPPKRVIALKNCFNINRRVDTKHKHVIALYTKDDCFCLVLESEEELEDWLTALLSLQRGEDVVDGEQPKPTFEHVWQVVVQKRGLGNSRNILGPHLLCLTDKTLSLVKMAPDENAETYEFSLMSIRRCGHSECFFYMEVGRSSCTGAGDLWMQVEDNNIAENMHDAILNSMSNNGSKEELAPKSRTRSSSATESSKPGSTTSWKQSHGTASVRSLSSATEDAVKMPSYIHKTSVSHSEQIAAYVMPDSTSSPQSHVFAASLPGSSHLSHHHNRPMVYLNQVSAVTHPSQRRHSVSAMSVSANSNGSSTTTTTTTGPSHQRTYSFPLSEPEPSSPWDTRRASTGRMGKRSGNSNRSTTAGRERSDSMPTRARTTSEGHPLPHPHAARNTHLIPGHGPNRPLSMYTRGISYSPPVGSSPVSPASGACSTDSAGSSLSIDDGEAWGESCSETNLGLGRYGHSLTPDEPVIFEENCDDYVSIGVEGETQLQDTMSPEQTSLGGNPSAPQRKFSPSVTGIGFKSGSPSQASYLEVYSSCGSSPLEGNFLSGVTADGNRVSHGHNPSSANHSRGSSFAEDTSGYLPMVAPSSFTDETSMSIDPSLESHINRKHVSDEFPHSHMSPASSCSVTSGTPSTDLRFSEYHLEKVSSFFTPSEEEETSSLERPARAYSVGSRPENTAKSSKVETVNQSDVSRVRAFSVGSRTAKGGRSTSHRSPNEHRQMRRQIMGQGPNLTPPSLHQLLSNHSNGKKSLSAPLLSNSWSGSANFRHLHGSHSSVEPMDDLMELDFRTPKHSTRSTKSSSFSSKMSKTEIPVAHRERSSPHSGSPSSHYLNGLMDTVRLPGVASMKPPISSSHLDTKISISGGVHVASPPNTSNTLSGSPLSSDIQTNDSTSPYVPMKNGVVISPYVPMKCGLPFVHSEMKVESSLQNGGAGSSPKSDMNSLRTTFESNRMHASTPFMNATYKTGALFNSAENIPTTTTSSRNIPSSYSATSQRKDSIDSIKTNSFSPPSCIVNSRKLSNSLDNNTQPSFDKNTNKSHSSEKTDDFDDSKYDSDNEYHLPDPTVFNDFSKSNVGPYVEMKPGPGSKAMRKNAQIYQNGVDTHISSSKSRGISSSRNNMSPARKKVVETDTALPLGEDEEDNTENTGSRSMPPRTPPVDTPQPKKTPEGYVEMWPGGSKPSQKSPLETYRPQARLDENEYMSINFENKSGGRRERRRRDRTRYSSQPIVINPSNVVNGYLKDGSSSAGVVFTASGNSGGKFFSNTSPKAPPGFLPIDGGVFSVNPGHSPFSSLRRSYTGTDTVRPIGSSNQQHRTESNGEVITPTGSNGAIFPLSPGSPIKPFPCMSSQVVKQSNSSAVQGMESYDSSSKCPVDATSGTVRIYSPTDAHSSTPESSATTPESGSSSEQPTPVNAEVSSDMLRGGTDCISERLEGIGDYAVMRPVPCPPRTHEATRKISAPAFVGNSRSGGIDSYIRKHFSNLNLSSPSLSSNSSSGAGSSFSHHQTVTPDNNVNEISVTPRVITSSSISSLMNKETASYNKDISGTENLISSAPVDSGSGNNTPKETSNAKALFTLRENSVEEEKTKDPLRSSNENCRLVNGDASEYVSLVECSTPRSPVSNERVLHYASLDLEDTGSRSPRSLTTQSSLTESSTSSTSPNPVQGSSCNDRFTYAEIDFTKSENLKNSSKKKQ